MNFKIGDILYELEVADFTRGNPCDPGEVEFADDVTYEDGWISKTIKLEDFIKLIAADRNVSFEDAAQILFEAGYQYECDRRDDE